MKDLQYRASLRAKGFYANLAETELAQILKQSSFDYVRRGYPDFTLLDLKGEEIWGFIEVKKYKETPLKEDQARFGRFCKKHNIPFLRWCPDDGAEAISNFLETGK